MANYVMRRPGATAPAAATTLRRLAATALGLSLIAAETAINLSHIIDTATPWHHQPLVIAVGIAGLAIAGGTMVLADASRQRRYPLALITFLGLAAAVAFTFATTYERTASAREDRGIAIGQTGKSKAAAAAIVASATEKRDAECVKRGPKCSIAETELTEARVALAVATPGKSGGYLGRFEGVSELALPLMLLLLGFAFIAYAEAPSRDDSQQTDFPAEDDPLPGREMFEPIAGATVPKTDAAARTAQVTEFATAFRAKHGVDPSVRTVAKAIGLPPTTVHRHLKRKAG